MIGFVSMSARFFKPVSGIIFTCLLLTLNGCATRYLMQSDRYQEIPSSEAGSAKHVDAISH